MLSPRYKIFSGTSHPELATEISQILNTELGAITIDTFACNEIYINLEESVRGNIIFIIQTATQRVNEDYMELFLLVDALKKSSADKVYVLLPYFGYARQDRRTKVRESLSAKVISNILETCGADHVISLNLHADQLQGFFNIPVENISMRGFFAQYFRDKKFDMKDVVVVSPDAGGAKAARKFADKLGASMAMMHKHRSGHNVSEVVAVIGDVKDKICILYDDMIDTGGSVCNAKKALIENGARAESIYLAATHAVFSKDAHIKLSEAQFAEVVVTNSIPVPREKRFTSLKILSVAPLFSQIIEHIIESKSVSMLHD